jgi:hypothetical protein
VYDNVIVQVIPPEVTLDINEDFNDGIAQQFVGDQVGNWAATAGRYASTAATNATTLIRPSWPPGDSPDDRTLNFAPRSARLASADSSSTKYSTNDFKFVALDIAAKDSSLVTSIRAADGWLTAPLVAR